METLKFLTVELLWNERNVLGRLKNENFFKELNIGDIFEYSAKDFLYHDVENLAKKHGVNIKYCKPGTIE